MCCISDINFAPSKTMHLRAFALQSPVSFWPTSRKHIRTKVTPDLHLTYSKNGGNLGLVLKR